MSGLYALAVTVSAFGLPYRVTEQLQPGMKMRIRIGLLMAGMMMAAVASAETCTTQSQMTAADRDALGGRSAWFGGEGSGR